ncbi:MAG: NifU family protein [Flavobacteriales bacterium]|jgi:Fe-S cluster biogenesis protein NfuA|nr:NifU family protein [Flavobacteriales bacterium]MDG2059394.1 NifU family protein [Flavobacteriales bacterium]
MNYSIYVESTPNPEVMKFVSNRMLADKSLEFLDASQAKNIPLANELFKLPFIKSVFISTNFVSINKTENVNWDDIALQVRLYISDYLNSIEIMNHTDNIQSEPIEEIQENSKVTNEKREFNGDEKEIADILDEYIRPAVESDGGAITLHSYKDGVVSVNLSGACNGCPSATITLKQGIQEILKQKLGDKIKEVISNNN